MNLPPGEPRCAACGLPLVIIPSGNVFCWVDPGGQTCAAHGQCLRALGEKDLDLPKAVG